MSHHFTNDKAVEKLEMREIRLLMLFACQGFKSVEANFQPLNSPYNQYLEKMPMAGDCYWGEFRW